MSLSRASRARQADPPQPRDRLAIALRWSRWPVLVVWLVASVALHPLANSLAGRANNTAAAQLPPSAPSTRVLILQQAAERGQPNVDAATVVFARDSRLTPADLAAVVSARAAVVRLAGHVTGLSAPGPVQRSADGQAAAFSADVSSPANTNSNDDAAVQAIRAAIAGPAGRARDGLQADVTGSAAVTADGDITTSSNTLLLTAILIVAVVLLLVYRSPVLWLLPLAGAVEAINVAKAAAYGLANAGLTVSSLSIAILTVLALGAASDYALLLVHRYREELLRHARTDDAMAVALRRTLPTLLASCGTVVSAMLCLLASGSATLHGLGPVGAVGVASALLVQVTFLPAVLLACGRWVFWPFIPRQRSGGREESRVWAGIGARIARHPARVAVAAVVLLGGACAGLAAMRTDNNPVASVPGHPGSVTGAQLLTEHFPAADHDPLTVLAPRGEAGVADATMRGTHGVTVAAAPAVGSYAAWTVTMSAPDYSAGAYATIASLRGALDRAAPGSLVGGDQAIQYDITQTAHRNDLVLIPLVLAVIFVVIALLLRALLAPLVLVATTALSFGASFGLSALLWRYGLGYSGVESELPVFIFIFLIALGVDYNIFLSARIREEAREHGLVAGTVRGLGLTGGVITAAGIVLAATFADLARLPNVPVAEVGTAIAIGVLLDTLLVRTVLVPASLLTIGRRVWWPARHL
jgi:putative drug exporter of the RND superfamily